jgi:hypothetical protein
VLTEELLDEALLTTLELLERLELLTLDGALELEITLDDAPPTTP